jgi:hypothetical protein
MPDRNSIAVRVESDLRTIRTGDFFGRQGHGFLPDPASRPERSLHTERDAVVCIPHCYRVALPVEDNLRFIRALAS